MRDRRAVARRASIATAAESLFRERGFDEVTADDIATAAGVSRRTLFRYFPSKNELVFGDLAEHLDRVADDVARESLQVTDRQAIAIAAVKIAQVVDDDKQVMWQRLRMIARDARLTERATRLHAKWQDDLARALAARRGSEVALADGMLASVAVAAHATAIRFWLVDRGESSFVTLTRDALAVLGLAPEVRRPSSRRRRSGG